MEKQPKPRKYGIPYVSLFEYDPTFISNVLSYNISWEDIPRNFRRIRTFLSFIAQIKYKELKCYSFLPSEFASEYYIFIDIDIGKTLMLVSTIRDSHQYPADSWNRVLKLREELLLLDSDYETLLSLKNIVDQQHQDG